MDAIQLKEYLKIAFELESSIFTYKKVITDYSNQRKNNIPKEPKLVLPKEPTLISADKTSSVSEENNKYGKYFAGLCISFLIALSLLMMTIGAVSVSPILYAIVLVFIGVGCYFSYLAYKQHQRVKEEKNRITTKNNELKNIYERQLQNYKAEDSNARKKYIENLTKYKSDLELYEKNTDERLSELTSVLKQQQNALNKLYAADIIYSKYRNFVAIATIYEYFESGRCCTLDGSNGAYNLYEGELRSNIIISSLNQIIINLEDIKIGQYALYEQINRSTVAVGEMLNCINNSQLLTAHYARAAALAASADRVIVGMTW